jgi:tetratricopeptide (TPR) repeat protein
MNSLRVRARRMIVATGILIVIASYGRCGQAAVSPPSSANLTDAQKLSPTCQFQAPKGKQARHRFDEFKYSESRQQGSTYVYGTIHGRATWTTARSPYVMIQNIFVAKDGLLRIEPGVTVKVARPEDEQTYGNAGYRLEVIGKLQATGRPDARIRFGAMSATPKRASEWAGIDLGGIYPNVLRWAVIEYAGAGVESSGCSLIAHCTFTNCHSGIWLNERFAGSVVHNVSAYNEYSGVRCRGTWSNATIRDNIFYANGDGIDAWNEAVAFADYNLYFANLSRWGRGSGVGCGPGSDPAYSGMEPGKHDLRIDPKFLGPKTGDFRLAKDSPARRAGYGKSDMGLAADAWSEGSAKEELDQWLAGGACAMWYLGVTLRTFHGCSCGGSNCTCALRVPNGPISSAQHYYLQALKLKPDPELRAKILCSMGHLLEAQGQHVQAQVFLSKALTAAQWPHLRDAARRELAESYAHDGNPARARALVGRCECAQSKVWAEPAEADYAAGMGSPDWALNHIAYLKKDEPHRYVETLAKMIRYVNERGNLDTSLKLLDGFKDYPTCEQANQARLALAATLRGRKRSEDAVRVLREGLNSDPFSAQATQTLDIIAETLRDDLGRNQEADEVTQRLARDYFPLDKAVARALAALGGAAPAPPRSRLALLDESLGESSIFDRNLVGSNNFGQYEILRALVDAGYTTHSTGRSERTLPAGDILGKYGLVIMNGRYCGTDEPPIPECAIETLVSYVNGGGSLLVIASGSELGQGKMPQFYNRLVSRFGLRFREGMTLPYDNRRGALTDHPSVSGLRGFWAAYGVAVDAEPRQVLGYCGKEPVIALADYGAGRVIVTGMGSGFTGQGMGKNEGENAEMNKALVVRLAAYLLDPSSQPAYDARASR